MEVKIVFNNESISKKFLLGWGFSCLVNNKILFDTGENGSWLMENMKSLNIDLDKIETVVISHDHWDHTRGLWELLRNKKRLTVYACPNFSAKFKNKVKKLKGKLIETEKFTEIAHPEISEKFRVLSPGNALHSSGKDIFVSGEIAGEYKSKYMPEQALVARTEKGLTVITGCSHPGIIKIIEKIKKNFPDEKIYLVFGGFHLMDKDKQEINIIAERVKKMGVQKIGPTHCTGYEAEEIFRDKYQSDFVPIKVGQVFEI